VLLTVPLLKRHNLPRGDATAAAPPIVREIPGTKNVPCSAPLAEQQRAAAAPTAMLALAPAPAPAPCHDALHTGKAGGACGVTIRVREEEGQEEEEEETPEGQRRERRNRPALAPGPARVLPFGPRDALAVFSAPHDDVTPGGRDPLG